MVYLNEEEFFKEVGAVSDVKVNKLLTDSNNKKQFYLSCLKFYKIISKYNDFEDLFKNVDNDFGDLIKTLKATKKENLIENMDGYVNEMFICCPLLTHTCQREESETEIKQWITDTAFPRSWISFYPKTIGEEYNQKMRHYILDKVNDKL